jgi:hypothetical protein
VSGGPSEHLKTLEEIESNDNPTSWRRCVRRPRYGDVAVELDALPVRVLRERITNEVRPRMSLDALEGAREQEREDKRRLGELLDQA